MTEAELLDYINSRINQNGKRAITGDVLNLALRSLLGLIEDGGTVNWGDIEGTLSAQTDLQTALNNKQNNLGFTPENVANKKTTLADNSDTFYPTQKAVKTAVDAKQDVPIVVDANITAQNDRVYHVVANATFTDPTPVEGRGYVVFLANGTITLGGQPNTHQSIYYRIYHTGSWFTYRFDNFTRLSNFFVPQIRTINGLDLSANRTLTTANINDSTDKRYVTDAQLTVIGNTSGTNTGDQVAMLSGILFANTNTGGAERFISPYSDTAAVSEFSRQIAVPKMTLNHFYVVLAVTQPATGSHVLTVRKNGVDTGLVITIPAGSSSGVFSATASVSFDIGDLLSIKCVNNASTSAGQINAISLFA